MDYEPGDTIDLETTKCGLIFRHVCKDNILPSTLAGKEHHNNGLESCPACGSVDTTYYTNIGSYCLTCHIVWKSELGVSCIECGRSLQPLGYDTLLCTWCGQRWELETVRDSYMLGDHDSQIDWSTPKGANVG